MIVHSTRSTVSAFLRLEWHTVGGLARPLTHTHILRVYLTPSPLKRRA